MMDRNLALEFVRVTEKAALASSYWIGKGDKHGADNAATQAMREGFNSVSISGTVVIGEGERDKAPMLFIGEKVGQGGPKIDIAVDPLECTNSVANGTPNAIAVFAAGPEGSLLHAPDTYMDKIAVGRKVGDKVHLDHSVKENIQIVAKALKKDVTDVTVIVLDRDRHRDLIKEIRAAGARVRLISDGDIAGGIAPSLSLSGIDMLLGTGAAPEGVITAAGVKCLEGFFQGRLKFRSVDDMIRYKKMSALDPNKLLEIEDLAKGQDVMFAATGILDGPMIKGIITKGSETITHSIVMRLPTKTIRFLETHHHPEKVRRHKNGQNQGQH